MINPNNEIYLELLRDKLKQNKVMLFAGAGWSTESNIISAWQLSQKLANNIGYKTQHYDSLGSVAEHYEYYHSRLDLINFLVQEIYDNKNPADSHRKAIEHPWAGIYTTNYDILIEKALDTIDKQYRKVLYNAHLIGTDSYTPVVKLHGCISPDYRWSDTVPIVITDKDYDIFINQRDALITKLQQFMSEGGVLLFVGYGLADQFWLDLRLRLSQIMGRNMPMSFSVVPNFTNEHQMYWKRRNIILIKYTAQAFFDLL